MRRVHQSSKRGARAAGSLECGEERNLYCPIVPLFPLSHHMPARPVHFQVSGANQHCILFHRGILSSAATLADQQHLCTHIRCTASTDAHIRLEGSHQDGSVRTGMWCFLFSEKELGVEE